MAFIDSNGRLLPATMCLLSAVSGVDRSVLRSCAVRSSKHNALRLPWFPQRKGGGAMVYGATIFMTRNFFHDARGHDLRQDRATLMLLAHEVVHVAQFARFQGSVFGPFQATVWATGIYVASFFQHGIDGYRKSSIEQEAERGRWVLRHLLNGLPKGQGDEVLSILERDDLEAMEQWLEDSNGRLKDLHSAYSGC